MWMPIKYKKGRLAMARSIERSMLNITQKDKIKNEVVRSKMQVKDIKKTAENKRPMGRTSYQNVQQQQVDQENNGMDTKREKQDERKT